MDNCTERVDARPSQIETAVEFWSGVETAVEETMLQLIYLFYY